MVKTRKEVAEAQGSKKLKIQGVAENSKPSNGKQKAKMAERENTDFQAETDQVYEGEQVPEQTEKTKKCKSKVKSVPASTSQPKRAVQALFHEGGKITKMEVTAQGSSSSEGEVTGSSSSESESDAESLDPEVSLNNNATTGHKSKPFADRDMTEDEALDYDEEGLDPEHSDTVPDESTGSSSSDDDLEEKRLMAKIKAVRKRKRKHGKHKKRGKKSTNKQGATLALVQKYCAKNGLVLASSDRARLPQYKRGRRGKFHTAITNNSRRKECFPSPSEATIYQNAVPKADWRSIRHDIGRDQDCVLVVPPRKVRSNTQLPLSEHVNKQLSRRFLAECRVSGAPDVPQPSTSRQGGGDRERSQEPPAEEEACYYEDLGQDRANRLIKEAETSKARLFELPKPGENFLQDRGDRGHASNFPMQGLDLTRPFLHSAMVDESYLMVATHVDEHLFNKIINHEYVDFSRLIPKDKVLEEDFGGMELIHKAGRTIFTPYVDRDATTISSFNRWEQAFRVFSAIYTKQYPHRASELIQYNHLIFSTSQTYVWSNIYAYDRDFRIHLSLNPG